MFDVWEDDGSLGPMAELESKERLRITDRSTTFHKETTCAIKPAQSASSHTARRIRLLPSPPRPPPSLGSRRSQLPRRRAERRCKEPRRRTGAQPDLVYRAGSHVQTSHVSPQDTAFRCNFVTILFFFADQFCHDS
jgi:hypothetical protein